MTRFLISGLAMIAGMHAVVFSLTLGSNSNWPMWSLVLSPLGSVVYFWGWIRLVRSSITKKE